MATFRFSRRDEADIYDIGLYTLRTWGETQTGRYISKLEACCQHLAENRRLGRPYDEIRQGLRRLEHGKHVVLYREAPGGILISRILQRMMPENPTGDDDEDTGTPLD